MKFEHGWIQDTLDSIDTAKTRYSYGYGLRDFWKWYVDQGNPDLTQNVLNRYKRSLQDKGHCTSTIAVYLCSVKLAIDINARSNDMSERLDLQDIKQRVSIKKIKSDNYSTTLTIEERDKLFATCKPNRRGVRNLAVLTLIFYAGLRRDEIEKLKLKDYDSSRELLFIRQAKHHKSRVLPLHPLSVERINDWLEMRGSPPNCDALFLNVTKGPPKGLTGSNVYGIMVSSCMKANIARYHPHDGRATYITMLHDNGVPIGDIQTLAGHTHADTTLGYVKTNFDKLRKAVLTLK